MKLVITGLVFTLLFSVWIIVPTMIRRRHAKNIDEVEEIE